jgi:putative FmdB family regulatory protein
MIKDGYIPRLSNIRVFAKMPVYTYRREDGTTFDYRQSFSDNPLTTDPETGQHVTRIVQAAGVIFKGSGFYVNDSKSASKKSLSTPATNEGGDKPAEKSSESSTSESSAKDSNASEKPAATKKSEPVAAAD